MIRSGKADSPAKIVAIVVASAAVLLVFAALDAQQADRTSTEAQSRRVADRLQMLHEEADSLAADERTVLNDLRRLELNREIKIEELRRAEADKATLDEELAALDQEIVTLTQQERSDSPALRARFVSLYKLGQGRYLRLLLSTTDLRDFGRASRMVAALANEDRDRVATHERRLDALNTSRKNLRERQTRLVSVRADAERAKTDADRAVLTRNARIREIDAQRDLNAQFSGELLSAQQKLQATLANIAAGGQGAAPSALPIRPFQGDLTWPVSGAVRQRFRAPGAGNSVTNGIDIAAAEGTAVQAVHDGIVVYAGPFTGFGRLVILDHGAQTFSLYGNLNDIATSRDARVQQGEAVGSVGVAPTGATGLYFELRIDGHPVDPLQWLRKR